MAVGPGAVASISPWGNADTRAIESLNAPFRRRGLEPQVQVDGRLALAWMDGPADAVHVSDRIICLLEGVLYDLDDLGRLAHEEGPPAKRLAAAYQRLGMDVLQHLRGDFWTLLWDRVAGTGILACDQMGGRSPYWAQSGNNLVVASDIPELLATMPRQPRPDPVAMAHWLAVTETPNGRQLFDGVRRLEPAHYLGLAPTAGDREPRRYWTPRYRAPLSDSVPELARQLRSNLERSVRRRVAGEPAAAVLLSGGLDSSVVATLANAVHRTPPAGASGAPLPAYTATFPDHPLVDEAALVDQTVAHLGLRSTRIVVRGGSVIGGALPYIATWRVPPTTPNLFFWAPLLGRAGADGVRVMLDGEGGDELFGVSPYLLSDRLRHGRALSAARLTTRFPGSPANPPARRTWRLLREFGMRGAIPLGVHRLLRQARGPERFAPSWMLPEIRDVWTSSEIEWGWKAIDGPRWWAWQVYAVTRGPGSPLVYEQSRRRAAMAGLEPRHPLVDVDVIELALQMPPELAYNVNLSRPLLRESISGMLPDEVRLRRAKSSFDSVFHAALAGPDLAAARRLLGAPGAELGAFVDLAAVRRELLEPTPPTDRVGRQRWSVQVWRMLMAECWLRAQADGAFLERLAESELPPRLDADLVVAGGTV